MYRAIIGLFGIAIILMGSVAISDTLMLKDGRVLTGSYKSGTASTIEFESDGSTKTYPLSTIISVTFQRPNAVPSSEQNLQKPAPPQFEAAPLTRAPN